MKPFLSAFILSMIMIGPLPNSAKAQFGLAADLVSCVNFKGNRALDTATLTAQMAAAIAGGGVKGFIGGLIPGAGNAMDRIRDKAEWVVEKCYWMREMQTLVEQKNIQAAVRLAAESHRDRYEESLEVNLAFDVDRYIDAHYTGVKTFNEPRNINPAVITSNTTERAYIEYFDYSDPDRLASGDWYDPREHERMRRATITENMNQIRDARARLATTASQIDALSSKAKSATTPEERRQIQIEITLLRAKQESEAQMISIAQSEIDNVKYMDEVATLTLQRNMANSMNQGLIEAGSLTKEQIERRSAATESKFQTNTGKPVYLRPRMKRGDPDN